MPASSALRILDRKTQEQREPKTPDFVEYVKIADGLKNIAYLSTAFIPKDIPQDIADAWRLYLVLSHSKRPIVSGAFTSWGVPRMGEIMAKFRAGKDDLVKKPMAIFTCCPNTPLRWGEDPIANIMDCADWGIPIEIVPVLLLGMISPATTVGALVLHTAEVLLGLTIAQIVRPGHARHLRGRARELPHAAHDQPHDRGRSAAALLRLRAGGQAPEAALPGLHGALATRSSTTPRRAWRPGVGAFLAASAGINSISGPGMLDYVNCFSLEKLVFDDEVVAHAKRFVRPVEVKEDLPAAELLAELVRDKHLLTSEHTLSHWPEELYLPGPMVDRTNWDQWRTRARSDWRDAR